MKTSLFKRKADLDSAADSYQKAAACFKVAKDFPQAIQIFTKAAECYTQNGSLYNAAKYVDWISKINYCSQETIFRNSIIF
jgi:TPR repeat protein